MKKLFISVMLLLSIGGALHTFADVPAIYRPHFFQASIKTSDYPVKIKSVVMYDGYYYSKKSIPFNIECLYPDEGTLSCYVYDENDNLVIEKREMWVRNVVLINNDSHSYENGKIKQQMEYNKNKGLAYCIGINISPDKLGYPSKNKIKIKIKVSHKKSSISTKFGEKESVKENSDIKNFILEEKDNRWFIVEDN